MLEIVLDIIVCCHLPCLEVKVKVKSQRLRSGLRSILWKRPRARSKVKAKINNKVQAESVR